MGGDKQHRNDNDKKAASTDVKDLVEMSPADYEKHEEQSRRERGKGHEHDLHGRIISVSVVGSQTKIMIAGHVKGMGGLEGYIKNGSGMLARFKMAIHDDRTAYAFVDLTPDQIKDHTDVVINPKAMPAASERREDIATRVVGVSVVGGKTKIMIGVGSNHGARAGMKGYLGENGKAYEHFVVSATHSTYSEAFVDTTVDDVQHHTSVMLNPSH